MAIPDFQTLMLPVLKAVSDGNSYAYREVVEKLANEFNLSEEERKTMLPSGTQRTFDNRVGWAKTYLKKAGLLESKKRGTFQITKVGSDLLKENPQKINVKVLMKYEAFNKSRTVTHPLAINNSSDDVESKTPEEIIEDGYLGIIEKLSSELLEIIKNSSPKFFEILVVDLLLKMGYGGSRIDAGKAIGKSSDGGIDGIIKEDKLGLDIIYIQAKKWDAPVPVREIRDFAGALLGKNAKKGIFITTSNFPKTAYEYVSHIEHKIVLIDGEKLAGLMIEHNVGVTVPRQS